MMKVAIVVIGYNRSASMERLLKSLAGASFNGFEDVPLIISLDKSDDHSVKKVAQRFDWPFGKKEIIHHKSRLGLRQHVLSCGDLSFDYDGVIVLEDDLMVSPIFYSYAVAALYAYRNSELIGGVSLYNYRYVDAIGFPFLPLLANGDIYFVKFPSSWGQAWTTGQWKAFRCWLDSGRDDECVDLDLKLPKPVISWPPSSWKKSFARYLIDANKYIAYPNASLTTNMGEPGQHWARGTDVAQAPIQYGSKKFVFADPMAAVSYDQFFELERRSFEALAVTNYISSDIEFDLYGQKPIALIKDKLVVSSKQTKAKLRSFGCKMLPHELNIAYDIKGEDFRLGKGSFFLPTSNRIRYRILQHHTSFIGGSDHAILLAKILSKRL